MALRAALPVLVLALLSALAGSNAASQVRFRSDELVSAERAAQREEILGRDVEVFRLDCRNARFRREISLFGNGTLRVREGAVEAPEMWLGELDRATTSGLIERLQGPDLADVETNSRTVVGDWVETCNFFLSLPGEASRDFQFERLDALELPLQKALSVAITALGMVDRSVPSEARDRLSARYTPLLGDVLVSDDGREFRVSGFASQRTVVEMTGVDQPVLRFYAVADLGKYFVSLKEPRR